MINDIALGVLAALARVLAPERRRAREMVRALAVALALVTTPGQGRAPVTRQASADRHLVDHLALGVLPARAGLAGGFYVANWNVVGERTFVTLFLALNYTPLEARSYLYEQIYRELRPNTTPIHSSIKRYLLDDSECRDNMSEKSRDFERRLGCRFTFLEWSSITREKNSAGTSGII